MLVENVRGFCNFDDLYMHFVNSASGGETFVELGSLWGRSAVRMASFIKESKKDIKFYCVDVWDLRGITAGEWSPEDISWAQRLGVDTVNNVDLCYEGFLSVLFKMQLQNYAFPIKLSSRVAHKLFADNSIDFLFIDAEHTYEGVSADIDLWLPKVREGGVIAGHDYDWDGVRKAVNEKFDHQSIVVHNTSWVCQR